MELGNSRNKYHSNQKINLDKPTQKAYNILIEMGNLSNQNLNTIGELI